VITNVPDYCMDEVTDHVMAMVLSYNRDLGRLDSAVKQGGWGKTPLPPHSRRMSTTTLGIIGLGRIGRALALKASAFGMTMLAHDPFVKPENAPPNVRMTTLDELLRSSDFVTVHSPLTAETSSLIDRQAIAKMRDGARLINAARGELVAEEALIEAIRSGKLAGAALDVFSREPYEGPLLELDEVVVTPHLAASTDEAQDRAGLIIAEQVAVALEGGLVTNAVNIPVVDAADLEVLGPFIPLAAKLGHLAVELTGGWPRKIAVAAHGPLSDYDTRLLTVAALNGVFQGRVDQTVNYVNAPVLAAERGIEVVEERFRASRDYMNLVEVRVTTDGEEVAVSGTTIGPEPRLFLAGAFGFAIDIELAPHMVFFRYDDVPGVIGRVGTMFGEAKVNIANMAVSRTKEGGKALMALSIDTPAPSELVERLYAVGFDDARFISLG